MARSISEFIQEQETGVVSTASDNYVQAYCECAIATSVAHSYLEQAQIALFATEYDTHVVQEQNIFSKIGSAIKGAWQKFWKWVRSLFKNIGRKVTEEKVTKMIDALLGIPDDTKIEKVDLRIVHIAIFTQYLNEQIKEINSVSDLGKINEGVIDNFENMINDLDEFVKEGKIKALHGKTASGKAGRYSYNQYETYKDSENNAKSIKSMTAGELKQLVADIETKNITKVIEEADKHITKLEKSMVTVTDLGTNDTSSSTASSGTMDDIKATTKVREATDIEKKGIETMKKLTQSLTAGYDRALKDFNEAYAITAPAIKAAANEKSEKALKEEKEKLGYKESFYFV